MTGPRGTAALAVLGTGVPGGSRRFLAALRRLAALAARRARRDVDLSFAVVDDRRMREMNRAALGHDWATDVLSYVLAEEPVLRGEIVLSADTARREAAARGHFPYDEAMLYAVHGVLHLLGHDDHAPKDRARMRRAERGLLAALGLGAVFGGAARARGEPRRGSRRASGPGSRP